MIDIGLTVHNIRIGNLVIQADLDIIYDNAIERNPYSCFSQSIYYQLTDSLIIKPIVHLVSPNPRSRQDASETLSVNIFPNPVVEDVIYIDLNHRARVEIYGLSGKKYLSQYFDAGYNQMSLLKINETVLLIKCTDMLGVESIHKIVRI